MTTGRLPLTVSNAAAPRAYGNSASQLARRRSHVFHKDLDWGTCNFIVAARLGSTRLDYHYKAVGPNRPIDPPTTRLSHNRSSRTPQSIIPHRASTGAAHLSILRSELVLLVLCGWILLPTATSVSSFCTGVGPRIEFHASILRVLSSDNRIAMAFKCHHSGCSRSYRRKEHLLRHQKDHSNSRNFACHACPSAFNRR